MRVLNSDGSEAEMCGNGIRCVAKLLYDTDPAMRRPTLRIETGAGVLECGLEVEDGAVRDRGRRDGPPALDPRRDSDAAGQTRGRALREPMTVRRPDVPASPRFRWATRTRSSSSTTRRRCATLAETYRARARDRRAFPKRTNVEFARVPTAAKSIWSSGSAAAASRSPAAPAPARPWSRPAWKSALQPGARRPVHLPGGTLFITVARTTPSAAGPTYAGVAMRGPASSVRPPSIRSPFAQRAERTLEQRALRLAVRAGGGTPRCS